MSTFATSPRWLPSAVLRYGLAVFCVVGALLVSQLVQHLVDAPAWYEFLAAVLISTWIGGLGPGVLAVLLSTLAIDYFFVPPLHTFSRDRAYLPGLIGFGLSALLLSWLTTKRKHAEVLLRQARDELEARVQERTAELRRTNEALSTEIAERKRAEESLRAQANLLNLTHDTVMVREMNGVITYWNRGAETMYGWTKEEALGKVSHLLLQTVFPQSLEHVLAELVRSGRWEGELIHTGRDGKRIVVVSRWALERDEQGRPVAALELNSDITARKRAEEALHQAQAELAHLTRVMTVGELAASIAHEVNQPLTAVITNGNAGLRWLARDPPNLEEAQEAMRRMIRDGSRASEVIARIRTLIRRAEPQKARLALNDVIEEVIALADSEVRRSRVLLKTDLAADLPPVLADRIQLQQVLLNLMLNGMEAMRAVTDRARELIVRSQSDETDTLRVAVQDCGAGIDPQDMDRIFTAFFTTKPEGLGMGLAISRSIIEAHGGRMWATPNVGPGVTVQFTLPTSEEAHHDGAEPAV
jgi:two-component system, LuxR family, sensor kinase FixL